MGAILDAARENKSKIVNIPHGTLAPYYNKYDKIFKKTYLREYFMKNLTILFVKQKLQMNFLRRKNLLEKY